MGSEDFGFLMKRFPGCYVRYGARIEGKGYIPLHSPQFDIDEDVLRVGAAFLEQVTREAIQDYTHEVSD